MLGVRCGVTLAFVSNRSMSHVLGYGVGWFLHVELVQGGIILCLARLASILSIFIGGLRFKRCNLWVRDLRFCSLGRISGIAW